MNRTLARLAGAGSMAGVLWLLLTASGCPMRDKEIRISSGGVKWVIQACEGGGGGNPTGGNSTGSGGNPGGNPVGGGYPTGGGNGPPLPPPNWPSDGTGGTRNATAGSGESAGSGGVGGAGGASAGAGGLSGAGGSGPPGSYKPCQLDNGTYYGTTRLADQQTEARLFLISPGDKRVQAASKCMRLHPCYDGGRSNRDDCLASDLNQQLDGAMPAGLGFDGLKNPDDAQLVLAFYQPTDSSEENGGCHRADIVACAGLAAPLGGGAYDISCASCQYGQKTTVGSDTGPCPRPTSSTESCFLWYCNDVLAGSGY